VEEIEMSIYMQYGSITGDATQSGFQKWVQLESFQFGAGRAISTSTGGATNREAHEPSIGEIVVTKMLDSSSGPIFQALCTDNKGQQCVISFVTTGNPGQTYLKYTLRDAIFSHMSMSSGGDRPVETLSLNFTEIALELTPLEGSNAAGSPFHYTYDIATAATG
jgi:type VI secretion system secreted protein Hcp